MEPFLPCYVTYSSVVLIITILCADNVLWCNVRANSAAGYAVPCSKLLELTMLTLLVRDVWANCGGPLNYAMLYNVSSNSAD